MTTSKKDIQINERIEDKFENEMFLFQNGAASLNFSGTLNIHTSQRGVHISKEQAKMVAELLIHFANS